MTCKSGVVLLFAHASHRQKMLEECAAKMRHKCFAEKKKTKQECRLALFWQHWHRNTHRVVTYTAYCTPHITHRVPTSHHHSLRLFLYYLSLLHTLARMNLSAFKGSTVLVRGVQRG